IAVSLFQSSLLQNTVQCTSSKIVIRFSWDGNSAGLCRMLKLTMATSGRYQEPAFIVQHSQYLTDLHPARISRTVVFRQTQIQVCSSIYLYMEFLATIWKLRSKSTPAELVPRLADPVQVKLPHLEVLLAGGDDCVLHVEFFRKALDCAPARVRMLDVGPLVQLEEFELAVRQAEELSPALPLQAEPAVL